MGELRRSSSMLTPSIRARRRRKPLCGKDSYFFYIAAGTPEEIFAKLIQVVRVVRAWWLGRALLGGPDTLPRIGATRTQTERLGLFQRLLYAPWAGHWAA
jgi:hypothetical protein